MHFPTENDLYDIHRLLMDEPPIELYGNPYALVLAYLTMKTGMRALDLKEPCAGELTDFINVIEQKLVKKYSQHESLLKGLGIVLFDGEIF